MKIGMTYGSLAPIAGLVPGQLGRAIRRLQNEADFLQGIPLRGSASLPIPDKLVTVENIFCGIDRQNCRWVYGDGPMMAIEKICFESPTGCAHYIQDAQLAGVLVIENESVMVPVIPDLLELNPHHGVLPSEYLEQVVKGDVRGVVFDTYHMYELPSTKYVSLEYCAAFAREKGFTNQTYLRECGRYAYLIHLQFDRQDNGQEMQQFENWQPGSPLLPLHEKLLTLLEMVTHKRCIGILLEPSFHHWRCLGLLKTALRPSAIIDHLCRQRDSLASWIAMVGV